MDPKTHIHTMCPPFSPFSPLPSHHHPPLPSPFKFTHTGRTGDTGDTAGLGDRRKRERGRRWYQEKKSPPANQRQFFFLEKIKKKTNNQTLDKVR